MFWTRILTHIRRGQWVSYNKNKSIDPLARCSARHPRGFYFLHTPIDSRSHLITFIPFTFFIRQQKKKLQNLPLNQILINSSFKFEPYGMLSNKFSFQCLVLLSSNLSFKIYFILEVYLFPQNLYLFALLKCLFLLVKYLKYSFSQNLYLKYICSPEIYAR